ncbi:MAG: hypothetical protein QXJ21_06560 [Thermofilum sp.]
MVDVQLLLKGFFLVELASASQLSDTQREEASGKLLALRRNL